MDGTLRVDSDALEQLSRQLADLQLKLDGLGRDVGTFDAAIGDSDVKKRLSDLTGNLTRSRQRIAGELKDLAALVSGAAAEYRATEAKLQAAVSEPGGPRQ